MTSAALNPTSGSVGVLGGVLLDLVVAVSDLEPAALDRRARIGATVGGVGFNVARNLAALGLKPAFLGALREGSILTAAIMEGVRQTQGVTAEIMTFPGVGESAYVDVSMLAGRTCLASSSALDDLTEENIEALACRVAAFDELILDSNLPPPLLDRLHREASRSGTRLSMASASDAKSDRLLTGSIYQTKRRLIGLNEDELRKVGLGGLLDCQDSSLLDQFFCENLLITRGSQGAVLIDRNGFFATEAPKCDIVDQTGAGDAMFSAVLYCLLRGIEPHSEEGAALVAAFVVDCLQRNGA